MPTTLAEKTALLEIHPSEYGRLDLVSLVELHNTFSENDWELDESLSKLLTQHPLLVSALEASANGVVIEVGHHRGITLAELAIAAQNGQVILGIDKGKKGEAWTLVPEGFSAMVPSNLPAEIASRGKKILNNGAFPEYSAFSRGPDTYRYSDKVFAVSGTTVEQALLPGTNVDLFFLKFMLGYLGKTPSESLQYLRDHILPRARGIFLLDYDGQCSHSKVEIPKPEILAAEISRAFGPSASIRQEIGPNYFMMYARR